ncbi:MAG TPA: biotin/lipoyl-containing protein [Anaerolineales bacterium]|nr:biotin/lipoyl-containing protein [Anaerolineales bacterium]
MKYVVTLDGETHEVEVRSETEIVLNGQVMRVDFQSLADQPVYSMLLGHESYEAYVSGSDATLQVMLRGQLYEVEVEDERQRRLRQASGFEPKSGGEVHLKAPMPGLIVAVPVEAGQAVERGQNLVILESMKMQNELRAPRDGTVQQVRVAAGERVEQNQVLITLG